MSRHWSQPSRSAKPYNPDHEKYASSQLQLDVYKAYGEMDSNIYKTAKKFNKDMSIISRIVHSIDKKAAKNGFIPAANFERFVGTGYSVKGMSTLVNADGDAINTWVKTDRDAEAREEALREFVQGLIDEMPKAEAKKFKGVSVSDLMAAIFIGDHHFGMYATKTETKHSDYDSDIATQLMREAIDDLVERSPPASKGLLVDVGDYMHANSSHNQTFSGTPVDVDTRMSRVLRKAGQAMRHAITRMLQKFPEVIVVVAKGNHNPDMAVAVQEIVKAYFHHEPRVTILQTDGDFHYIEYGQWLIGINHGNKIKPEQLVSCMARDMSAAWGRTKFRMWAVGHYHHQDTKEINGVLVQKFGALPPPDAWHSSMGYGSGQSMQLIVFKKWGGRHSTLIYELPRPGLEPDFKID